MNLSKNSRPQVLSEMIGQVKTVEEFKERFKTGTIPDTTIIIGKSGTGKTTLATIIAKLANCQNPVTNRRTGEVTPCNKCASCIDINEETFSRDVLFKDASKMSKDDVLKLEEYVSYSPQYDKNKIVIIDEAQELSKSQKGATLDLLQKKRNGVHFILCAMEDKFDKAVLRRGQVYRFRPVSYQDIAKHLFDLIEKNNIECPDSFFDPDTGGLWTIAENCEGSPGIAIPFLERAIYAKLWTSTDVMEELGLVKESYVSEVLIGLLKKDKSYFEKFSKINFDEFYMKSKKILGDASIYSITNYTSEAWKEKNAKVISTSPNLKKLINIFLEVEKYPFLNDFAFKVKLVEYLNEKAIVNVKSEPEIKTRRRG